MARLDNTTRLVAFVVAGIILGALVGYGSANYVSQTKMDALNMDLMKTRADLSAGEESLNATRIELEANTVELEAKSGEADMLTVQLTQSKKDLEDARALLNENPDSLVVALSKQLQEKTSELSLAREELERMKSRKITAVATGQGVVQDSETDVLTRKTLIMNITWTQQSGWSGFGLYQVESMENNTETGLEVGYVYIFEVFKLDDITITGNKIDVKGRVYLTDRPSLTLGQSVIITGTDSGPGEGDEIHVSWPALEGAEMTLTGSLTIAQNP